MKLSLLILTSLLSTGTFAAPSSTSLKLPQIEGLVLGDIRVAQAILTMTQDSRRTLSVGEILTSESEPGKVQVCLQMKAIGSDTVRYVGAIRADLTIEVLGGRPGGEHREVTSVASSTDMSDESNLCQR